MSIKTVIGNFIRKLISPRAYRILRLRPIIIPSYYKNIIEEVEKIIDIQQFDNTQEDEEVAMLLLRKYAHIIDKGLQRKDFKPGHSKIIFEQAKNSLSKIKSKHLREDASVVWSIEKLNDYELRQKGSIDDNTNTEEIYAGSYDDLLVLMKNRRSARYYLKRTVENDVIEKVIEPINWASSSCNKQPIKVFATNNSKLAKDCLDQCKGATGFGEYVPSFMAICADMRGYVLPSEMYLPMIDVSLGVQNSVLAVHTLGLSCTILSWAQKDEREDKLLRELLEIPEHYAIIFNMAMGYPESNPPIPMRKSISSTLVFK